MKSVLLVITIFASGFVTWQPKFTASSKDFIIATGNWTGKLTYLDYSSGKPFTMPANVMINLPSERKNEVVLALVYPQEPNANANDTLFISEDGTHINGAKITSKQKLTDGSLQLITDKDGKDGNDHKKALLRHIYTIGKNNFSNRKEVKFQGTDQWILRNEYVFSR